VVFSSAPLCRFFRLPRPLIPIESVAPSRSGRKQIQFCLPAWYGIPTILELQQMEPATQPQGLVALSNDPSSSLNDLCRKTFQSCISRHMIPVCSYPGASGDPTSGPTSSSPTSVPVEWCDHWAYKQSDHGKIRHRQLVHQQVATSASPTIYPTGTGELASGLD
jgi:hypothetical protein